MRLYAYHNGEKHEVDLALFPVGLNEEGDVVFTEDQHKPSSSDHYSGYRKGVSLTDHPSLRLKLPLVSGDTLVATVTDWFVKPEGLRLYAYHNGEKYEIDTTLFPVQINESGEVVHVESYESVDSDLYARGEELKSLYTREYPLINGGVLVAKITSWVVEL